MCKRVTASPGSGWEQREDLGVQGMAAIAAQKGTVLLRLCTLPWKQSWILNRDVRVCGHEPTVCCPFGLTSFCSSPRMVTAALHSVGGREAYA